MLPAPHAIALPDADLTFYPRIALDDADALLARLITDTPWRQEHVTLFGQTRPQPRLVAWYGDAGAHYRYSGLDHAPLPWTDDLAQLRAQLAELCDCPFNSVLLNYYRDHRDAMGLHSDNEPELGPQPVIAALSLGATRRLYFRHRKQRKLPGLNLDLPGGSLLVMRGTTQACWRHGIRRQRQPCGPRVNLTFRLITSTATARH